MSYWQLQLDYNEALYCKVLLYEIFGRENFQKEIIWRIGWVSGFKTADKNWIRNHNTDFYKKYIPYSKDYDRRDGSKPEGESYPYEDTWNCSDLDPLHSIAIVGFTKEKLGRRWIGCDLSKFAIQVTRKRLLDIHNSKDLVEDE